MLPRAPRWSAHYHVQFAYPEYAGEGMTLDISIEGICMVTTKTIRTGEQLYIQLLLGGENPSCIECQIAPVMWCRNGKMGLQLCLMEQNDKQHYLKLLQGLATTAEAKIEGYVLDPNIQNSWKYWRMVH